VGPPGHNTALGSLRQNRTMMPGQEVTATQVACDGNEAETSPDGVAVGSLLINSTERYSEFYLDTCEQRLVAAGA
jgi:hypothetical protein